MLVDVADAAVGVDDPMAEVVGDRRIGDGGVDRVDDRLPVAGMDGVEELFVGREKRLRLGPEDTIDLVTPFDGAGQDVPVPTADMGHRLRGV